MAVPVWKSTLIVLHLKLNRLCPSPVMLISQMGGFLLSSSIARHSVFQTTSIYVKHIHTLSHLFIPNSDARISFQLLELKKRFKPVKLTRHYCNDNSKPYDFLFSSISPKWSILHIWKCVRSYDMVRVLWLHQNNVVQNSFKTAIDNFF